MCFVGVHIMLDNTLIMCYTAYRHFASGGIAAMAVYTFIGHGSIYDLDIRERLKKAVFSAVRKNDVVEFVPGGNGDFYSWSLAAALEAKHRYPKKAITTAAPEAIAGTFPVCAIDCVIIQQSPMGAKVQATVRQTVKASDVVISYCYDGVSKADSELRRYALAQGKKLIDITSPDTAAQLALADGNRTAIKAMRVRVQSNKPCAIFALGPATSDRVNLFGETVDFIMSAYGVEHFLIAAEYIGSAFAQELRHRKAHITAVAHYNAANGAPPELRARYCHLCQDFINVATEAKGPRTKALASIRWMLGSADFAICRLAGSPIELTLRRCMADTKGVAVFDMGRMPSNGQVF